MRKFPFDYRDQSLYDDGCYVRSQRMAIGMYVEESACRDNTQLHCIWYIVISMEP